MEPAEWLLCGHYYSLGTVTLGEAWVSMLELAAGACRMWFLRSQVPVRRASSSEFLLLGSALNACSSAVL